MRKHYQATIAQGISFLRRVSQVQYTALPAGCYGSIGHHTRHINDHFFAVKNSLASGIVDYETRQRGSLTEKSLLTGIQELTQFQSWVGSVPTARFDEDILVNADIGVGESNIIQLKSSLGRELMFSCSHAIHHYAVMKLVFQKLGGRADSQFGISPSTATFMRLRSKHDSVGNTGTLT